MSILEDLLAAVNTSNELTAKNNELLEAAAVGRDQVMELARAATTKPAAASKAAAKPAAAATTSTHPSLDDMKKSIQAYGAVEDEAERTARRDKIVAVLAKVKATNASEVPEDKRAAVIKAMNTLVEAGNLTSPAEAADADEDLLG